MTNQISGSGDHLNDDNIFKILVATDVHLGYKEKYPDRGQDAFNTFEEIFQIAKQKEVDFVLLGGDLFHSSRPTKRCIHDATEIMRKYCIGKQKCKVKILNDQKANFGHTSEVASSVNYEDPDMNIAIPVFSIHGNHDDPTGVKRLSAIDILSASGLLNHFGKSPDHTSIRISPVLMQKGVTKLAMYGLGSINDSRLNKLFKENKVNFDTLDDQDEWFNLMVIHQNRVAHAPDKYIPESYLDKILDLVIWCHEHESIPKAKLNQEQGFHVLQPGSTVATSLKESESKQKHAFLVRLYKKEFKCEPIKLNSVRQMYFKNVVLKDLFPSPNDLTINKEIKIFCTNLVNKFVEKAELERNPHQPTTPLVRLRIDARGDYPKLVPRKFGVKFLESVSNHDNIISYVKNQEGNPACNVNIGDVPESVRVEDLVASSTPSRLALLTYPDMTNALERYVWKKEGSAFESVAEKVIEEATDNYLRKNYKAFSQEVLQSLHDYLNKGTSVQIQNIFTVPNKISYPPNAVLNFDTSDKLEAKRKTSKISLPKRNFIQNCINIQATEQSATTSQFKALLTSPLPNKRMRMSSTISPNKTDNSQKIKQPPIGIWASSTMKIKRPKLVNIPTEVIEVSDDES